MIETLRVSVCDPDFSPKLSQSLLKLTLSSNIYRPPQALLTVTPFIYRRRRRKKVEGKIKLKLYKGNIIILERSSKKSLYSKDIASFEGTKMFNSKNAEKFIKKKRYKF